MDPCLYLLTKIGVRQNGGPRQVTYLSTKQNHWFDGVHLIIQACITHILCTCKLCAQPRDARLCCTVSLSVEPRLCVSEHAGHRDRWSARCGTDNAHAPCWSLSHWLRKMPINPLIFSHVILCSLPRDARQNHKKILKSEKISWKPIFAYTIVHNLLCKMSGNPEISWILSSLITKLAGPNSHYIFIRQQNNLFDRAHLLLQAYITHILHMCKLCAQLRDAHLRWHARDYFLRVDKYEPLFFSSSYFLPIW